MRFLVGSVLDLAKLDERWDTVLDCGVFHVFDDDDRWRTSRSLAAAVVSGGRYFMLCFSDAGSPAGWARDESRRPRSASAFADGWRIDSIEPAVIETTIEDRDAKAWLTADHPGSEARLFRAVRRDRCRVAPSRTCPGANPEVQMQASSRLAPVRMAVRTGLAVLVIAGLIGVAAPAQAVVSLTAFTLDSEQGDSIGAGQSLVFKNAAVTATGDDTALTVTADDGGRTTSWPNWRRRPAAP